MCSRTLSEASYWEAMSWNRVEATEKKKIIQPDKGLIKRSKHVAVGFILKYKLHLAYICIGLTL